MLAVNLKTKPMFAEMSSTKIILPKAPAPMRFHSPIQESVNMECKVNRKYAITTASMPIFSRVTNFCSAIKSTMCAVQI